MHTPDESYVYILYVHIHFKRSTYFTTFCITAVMYICTHMYVHIYVCPYTSIPCIALHHFPIYVCTQLNPYMKREMLREYKIIYTILELKF